MGLRPVKTYSQDFVPAITRLILVEASKLWAVNYRCQSMKTCDRCRDANVPWNCGNPCFSYQNIDF